MVRVSWYSDTRRRGIGF